MCIIYYRGAIVVFSGDFKIICVIAIVYISINIMFCG